MALSKRHKQLLTPSFRPSVVVASVGRSGSTVLFKSVAEAMSNARFSRRREFVFDESWTLAEGPLRRGVVYKTHDFPAGLARRSGVRTLFVFAKASDIVRSVIHQHSKHGDPWIAQHLIHMKATGAFEDICTQDILNIGDHLHAWTTFTASPVLCIKYDAMWGAVDRIGDFVRLPVTLPERRNRASHLLDPAREADIARTYAALDAHIENLPDIFEQKDLSGT